MTSDATLPKEFKLAHNAASSLFTANVSVGTPPQKSEMLIDLSGMHSFVFSQATHTYLTRAHKFYKISDSVSGFYVNKSSLYMANALGFQFQAQPIKDVTCMEGVNENNFCFSGKFMSVITMNNNYWNYDMNLENVGGILGFNTADCDKKCTSLWQKSPYDISEITIALAPHSDYDWWYKAKDKQNNLAFMESYIKLNDKKYVGTVTDSSKKVTLESDSNELKYTASSFKFGSKDLAESTYGMQVEFSMGIAGIGLPQDEYMEVARQLYDKNPKIICPSSFGGMCHTDLYCAQLLDSIEDLSFNIAFDTKKKFDMPIATVMRQADTQCNIMVTNLGSTKLVEGAVIGSSFLQQYALEFEPAKGTSGSKAHFYAQSSALSGAGLSGDEGSIVLPILFALLVIGLLLAGISYVCYKCVQKKKKTAREQKLGDSEVNGSLLESGAEAEGSQSSLDGVAPEDM